MSSLRSQSESKQLFIGKQAAETGYKDSGWPQEKPSPPGLWKSPLAALSCLFPVCTDRTWHFLPGSACLRGIPHSFFAGSLQQLGFSIYPLLIMQRAQTSDHHPRTVRSTGTLTPPSAACFFPDFPSDATQTITASLKTLQSSYPSLLCPQHLHHPC